MGYYSPSDLIGLINNGPCLSSAEEQINLDYAPKNEITCWQSPKVLIILLS